MDPDATLRLIRKLVTAANERDLTLEEATFLAELIEALDGWMSKGGFPPAFWGERA